MRNKRTPPGSGAGPTKAAGKGDLSARSVAASGGPAKRPLIYLAASLTDRDSLSYRRLVRNLHAAYPSAEFFDPGHRFASLVEWQTQWPKLVRVLGRLIVVGDERGVVGVLDMIELQDALTSGIEVIFGTRDGRFVPIGDVYVTPFNDPTPEAAAHVVERRLINPALIAELDRMPEVTLDGFLDLLRRHEAGDPAWRPN